MSILLVDIGNTRVKWATLERGRIGRLQAAAHDGWTAARFGQRVLRRRSGIDRILVASVAGERTDRAFEAAARRLAGVEPEFVVAVRRAGGVTTRYVEPWRLGVDRFVAVIGAYALAGRRAACVIDVGTAMTIDCVDARGSHRGGVIVPGPDLMMQSLLRSTSGIARRANGRRTGASLFARSTREAIEQGARHAVAATIDRAVDEAGSALGRGMPVFLTGGAAEQVRPLLRSPHRSVPDLVLRGLAVLASGEPG